MLDNVYPKKFAVGDIAIAKLNVSFVNGTKHHVGQRIDVTEKNVAYYNVNHRDYDREQKPD